MNDILAIRISGDDALDFLQGQLTNDLQRLEEEADILAGWCNPKGRVIWFGTVQKTGDGYSLSAASDMAEAIVQRLTMFRFRSDVNFNVVDEGKSADPLELIEKGHAWIGTQQAEQFTPHMLNLDLVDAISFDKGCYTGQEIVARTHNRGATKRRTMHFESESPLAVGGKITAEGRVIGEVLNTAGNALLAVVAMAKSSKKLFVENIELKLKSLPYLPDQQADEIVDGET